MDGPRAANTTGKESRYIPLEVIIAEHLDTLFPGMEVVEHHVFRVTRNEDLEVEEDDAENLLQASKGAAGADVSVAARAS